MCAVVWDFEGQEDNLHGDRRANVWQINVCWAIFNSGAQIKSLASFLPVCCTLLCVTRQLSMKMAPIWEQVLYLNSFRHLGGRSKVFPVFCLLKITGLKYQKVIFLGGKLCSPLFPLLNIVSVFNLCCCM